MSTEATPTEVVTEIPENLALAVKSTGLDTQAAEVIEASFAPLFVQANKWAGQFLAGLELLHLLRLAESESLELLAGVAAGLGELGNDIL